MQPHCGHWGMFLHPNVRSTPNQASMFEVQMWGFISRTHFKNKFLIWSSEAIKTPIYKTPKYCKYLKILQIPQNTANTYKYNTCTMRYFLCLEVCYLVLFFGLCSLLYVSLVYVFWSWSIYQLLSIFNVLIFVLKRIWISHLHL